MSEIDKLIAKLSANILNPFITLLFGCAVVIFIYGVVEFVWGADNEEARSKGAQHILWGLVGIVIMIGALTIKSFIKNTIGV